MKNRIAGSEKAAKGFAIIGISANIGGTNDLEGYWDAIRKGQDCIRSLPENRWEDAEQLKLLRDGSGLSEHMGQSAYLDEIDQFDPGFFNIAKSEADLMDPAQRMFLECAWSALEDAGCTAVGLNKSRTGVYVGYSSQGGQYAQAIEKDADNFVASVSGNLNSIIASRVSYCFNLKGPAIVFDTACSSSLTALHTACLQLKNGECDMALVGSVSLTLIPRETDGEKMGIESSSERTKTFDDSADGTGGGEGVIAIVIKSLSHAIEDRDHIYAVIKSSAINQDGTSLGITAPNSAAQEAVIVEAWQAAGIDPLTVSYI
ncbi:MAG: polyketide synthase [Lachnospiraceae bacterium]|nr:polyketide synthase [Lachnospiraceae bacterium]